MTDMETFNFSTNHLERFSSSVSEGDQEKSTRPGKVNDTANASMIDLHLPKKRKLDVTPLDSDMYFRSKQNDQSCGNDIQFKRQSKNLLEWIRKCNDESNSSSTNILPPSDSCESLNDGRITRKMPCLQRELQPFSYPLQTNNGLNNHHPGSYIGVESSQTQFLKHGSFPDLAPSIAPFSNVPSLQNTTVHSAQHLASTLKRYSLPLATSITSCPESRNLQNMTQTLWKNGQTSMTQSQKLTDKDFSRVTGSMNTRFSHQADHQEQVEAEINKLKGKLADFIMKQNLLQSTSLDGDNCSSNGDEESHDVSQERRKKNNEAAKRSRDARRLKEDETALRAGILEVENYQLRMELIKWQRESARLNNIAQMINR